MCRLMIETITTIQATFVAVQCARATVLRAVSFVAYRPLKEK